MKCNYTHHDDSMPTKCPVCGHDLVCTIYAHKCNNTECSTYSAFDWAQCGICRQPRVYCSC